MFLKRISGFCEPLKYLSHLSIERGVFPDDLKIVKITSIYKADYKNDLSTYRHGTIIRAGITCKKTPCYMCDSACRWFIVKKAKIF